MNKAALVVSLLGAAHTARVARKRSTEETVHTIAGVPVLNYHLAPKGLSVANHGEDLKSPWVVVAQPGKLDDASLEKACKRAGVCEKVGHPEKGGVPYFVVHATEGELQDVLGASVGSFSFIEPDVEAKLIPEEEAEASSSLWGLNRVGAYTRASEGKGAHVYVLDTGIRSSHVDFGGRSSAAIDLTSGSLVECAGEATCGGDKQSHGTHCAGTVAGSSYGVAPQATLHAGKVLSDSGSGQFSWSYDALDWLASKGERPAVASMSLGGSGTLSAMRVAVTTAVEAGVTVVVAGGNSNSDACGFSPAFVPEAITVGSTTSNDARSSFSNYGSCTNIWAPGSSIVSAGISSDTSSTSKSGTSMACPHVSGGVALLVADEPSLTPTDVLERLLAAAEYGALSDLKTGDTNALLWVGSGPAPQPAPTPAPPPYGCPDFAYSSVPDRDGDCRCPTGQLCSRSGVSIDCPTSGSVGGWGGRYWFYTCADCLCYDSTELTQ